MAGLATCLQVELSRLSLFLQVFSQLFGTDQFGVVTFIIQGVNLEEYLNIKLMLPDLRRCGPYIANNVLYNSSLTIENHLFFMCR